MSIHKAANHSKNQQDTQEHLILWQSFIKDTDTAYHRDKVKKLADECRDNFPKYGQNAVSYTHIDVYKRQVIYSYFFITNRLPIYKSL